jgi:transposase InsO family protein
MVAEVIVAVALAWPVFTTEISPMESSRVEPAAALPASAAAGSVGERFDAAYHRVEGQHVDRVRRLIQTEAAAANPPRRRGPAWQQRRRQLQREVRQESVVCYQELRQRGYTLDEVAGLLELRPRTLRHWQQNGGPQQRTVVPLGRPCARAPVSRRQEVLGFLQDQGPGVGVPTLHAQFPDLARAELSALVQRYRHVLAVRHKTSSRVLHWLVPGRVWALDFAEPSRWGQGQVLPPLEGRYPYLLAVRDLASGYQLAWLPVTAATSATTCAVLAQLFACYGKPLVLKADNGPAFRAHQTKRFVEQAGVHFLFSPPYWPGYNGSIEAAIGSLKNRTEHHAAEQGHAGRWTRVDVQAARRQANQSQPRRLHGLTPAEAWARRMLVTDVERVRFERTVERQRYVARNELGLAQTLELDHWRGSALDRKAIERALVEHDYLLFRGRRVPLTITPGKVTFFV